MGPPQRRSIESFQPPVALGRHARYSLVIEVACALGARVGERLSEMLGGKGATVSSAVERHRETWLAWFGFVFFPHHRRVQ